MMRYIRTKDGIYEYGTNGHKNPPYYCVPNCDDTKLLIKDGLARDYPIEEHTIIKQADSIKELCDAAIVDHTICIDHKWGGADWERAMKLKSLFPNSKLRGAIWTDKGLIYVAELNDEGKLELLYENSTER